MWHRLAHHVRPLASLCLCLLVFGRAWAGEPERSEAPRPPNGSREQTTADGKAALVRKLGDEAYEVRREASRQLAELGLEARATLEAGLKDPDPEVRRRCRWVLQDVLQADYHKRLEAFVADTEGRQQHDLPGWDRYRQIVGTGRPARELFIQMQKAEYGLLISAAAGPQPAADALRLRLRQVCSFLWNRDPRRRKPPSLGTTAALLLVTSDARLNLPTEPINVSYVSTLIQQADFRKALTSGKYKPAARKLLGGWIACPADPNLLRMKLQMAVQYDIPEGLDLALKAVKDIKRIPGTTRAYGVMAIGRLCGKQHAATLAGLLDDETECTRRTINGKVVKVEIRDVALAWLIHLTGQKHADYGQDRAKSEFDRISKSQHYYVNTSNFGFESPAKRDEALKKWKSWAAAHPLPEPPAKKPVDAPKQPAENPNKKAAANAAARPVAGANVVVAPGVAIPAAVGKVSQEEPQDSGLDAADRLLVRKLNVARQLCRQQRYVEATRLLDEILKGKSHCSFRPDPKVPLFRCIKPAAEQLIGRLPTKGREAYELHFGAVARQLLNRAVSSGTAEALAAVAERFFYTQAGAEATYLLAAHYLNHGHPLHAALYLERLQRRSWHADRFEPVLSATLATCWSRAGMPQASEAVLLRMQAAYPGATLRIGGQRRTLFSRPEQARSWLESLVGPPPRAEVGGWPMLGGDPARNASADVGGLFLKAEPLTLICEPPLDETVEKLRTQRLEQYRVALPKLHPLVVGETILLRTATHLRAIEFAGGKLRWESPLEDPLWHSLHGGTGEQDPPQADSLAEGLQHRLWEDGLFGTLSSDGHGVFGVEDLAFELGADHQRMVVLPDGRWRLDPGSLKQHNLLTAYDVASGKLRWEIGGPPGVEMVRQPDTFFLGPPLPLGGRLYVVAEVENETRLLELEAKTGNLISSLALAAREEDPSMRMLALMPFGLPPGPRRRHGRSPSYADGVLVCTTGENHVVAVDLTTRQLLWIYRAPDPQPPVGMNRLLAMQLGISPDLDHDQSNCWADASATLADGRVLLTLPDSNKLICLNLADGDLQWSVDRRDGLYLGAVDEQNVVVVGRGGVWAVRLADGTPAWPQQRVPLPAGGLPSGRGYLGEHRYYLPLTTAEVVAVDVRSGRLVSRSRSPDGIIPGNLVACRRAVLSQSVAGFWRFEPLATRSRQLAAAVRERPGDPQALCDLGEALLYDGQLAEAVGHLKRAMAIRPTPRARQLLADALVDGLRVDFDHFREPAERFVPLIETSDARTGFLQQYALALQRAREIQPALEIYLKLIEMQSDQHELQHFAAARAVRRDRWIQARLAELRDAASPDQRAEMDRQVTARLNHGRPQSLLAYLGPDPAAHDVRLRLAEELAGKQQWLEAERLLRHVLRQGSESQRRVAVARLAALLRAAERPDQAARFYGHLGGELAEAVCLEGKTGRELFDALPADDPVRRHLTSRHRWPVGKVRCEVSGKRSSIEPRYPIAVVGEGGQFGTQASVDMDPRHRKLVGCDGLGRQQWEVPLKQQQMGIYHHSALQSLARGRLKGHVLVAQWYGHVYAIDTLAGKAKMLWTQEVYAAKPQVPGMPVFFGGMFALGMPQPAGAPPASKPLTLAVSNAGVCFQQGRKLLAVDPLSGQVLWTRDDLRAGSDLFGDDELLFVTPPHANEAAVFSMLDGRELRQCPVPELKQRIWTLGRRVLTWSTGPFGRSREQTPTDGREKAQLTLVDPWTGKDVWQRDFEAGAQPWLVEGHEIGVLEPQGRLTILALPGGDTILETKANPSGGGLFQTTPDGRPPSLQNIVLLRSEDRYVLAANHLSPQVNAISVEPYYRLVPINGCVYGFDRQTGKRIWKMEVKEQALRLDQPGELPVLTFFNRLRTKQGNTYKTTTKMLLLDRRTGHVLHDQTTSKSASSAYEIHADPDDRRVEIRSYLGTVRLTFTDEPAGDEPVEKVVAADKPTARKEPTLNEGATRETAVQRILRILKAAAKAKREKEAKLKPLPKSK